MDFCLSPLITYFSITRFETRKSSCVSFHLSSMFVEFETIAFIIFNSVCCCRLLSLSTNSSLTISSNYAKCTLQQTDQISLAIENNNNNKGKRRRKKNNNISLWYEPKKQILQCDYHTEQSFCLFSLHRNRTVPSDCCRGSCLYESLYIYISNTNQ